MPIGAAVVGAAGAIGGAVLAGNAQKSAAKKASQAQQGATAQQIQFGKESLALQEKMFNQGLGFNKMAAGVSYDALSPFVGSGLGATNMVNALLGITPVSMGANPYNTPAPPGGAASIGTTPGGAAGGNALAPGQPFGAQPSGADLANYLQSRF